MWPGEASQPSLTRDAITRTFLNTAPGEVISITADFGSTPRFWRRSMTPSVPKVVMSAPLLASTA